MTMKIDVVASEPHYLDHLRPIFDALPAEARGQVYGGSDPWSMRPRGLNRLTLVAGFQDVRNGHGRMVYVEHGAGQSYAGDPKSAHQPGYSGPGGQRHRGVVAYIAPSERVARRWRSATSKPAIAVGCPKLDRFIIEPPRPDPRSVCIAFHWDCQVSPESRSAYRHYAERLPRIVDAWQRQGWTVYAHSHPRWRGELDSWFTSGGAEVLERDVDVFHNASTLVVDNSSLAVEALVAGADLVWLDAPWYRRNVSHGGRFWDWTRGIPTVPGPDVLLERRLHDIIRHTEPGAHDAVINDAYAFTDGTSAERAAAFVLTLADEQ